MFIIVEFDTVNFNVKQNSKGEPIIFFSEKEASEYAMDNCIHEYRVVEF